MLDLIGLLAAGLVLLTFSMRSMVSLRITAIASNMAFITYAALGGMVPILVLHAILLPLNCWYWWQGHGRGGKLVGRPAGTRRPGPQTAPLISAAYTPFSDDVQPWRPAVGRRALRTPCVVR